MAEKEQWHLDKKVPVAIIFAIAMQTIGAVWWAATVNSELKDSRMQISVLKEDLKEQKNNTDNAIQNISELKIHLQYMNNTLTEIKDFLKNEVKWQKEKE